MAGGGAGKHAPEKSGLEAAAGRFMFLFCGSDGLNYAGGVLL